MTEDSCRYWRCDEPAREDVAGFDGQFCCEWHVIKYEHIKADADSARAEGCRHAQ